MMYEVIVNNEILGDTTVVMDKKTLSQFNKVALMLSNKVDEHGGPHTSGMWTVRPHEYTTHPGKEVSSAQLLDCGRCVRDTKECTDCNNFDRWIPIED